MSDLSLSERVLEAVGYDEPAGYVWTRDVVATPLKTEAVDDIVESVLSQLAGENVVLPEPEELVRRCVIALMSGHLVLQGPPGTGKTTLARVLAAAFEASLEVATATSDWGPYDVVGGLRPSRHGRLVPGLGCVTHAALSCALAVRDGAEYQAVWLLLDELNRADIDKAVGSLYTVLSSVGIQHLERTPVDLWFGEGESAALWVPARFRIIGTMNDVDTSFVNSLSQGLARRFQFVYVGVPPLTDLDDEVRQTLLQAHGWVVANLPHLYAGEGPDAAEAGAGLRVTLAQLVKGLRYPDDGAGWPLGSAQLVDVWRSLLVEFPTLEGARPSHLDLAVADRIVPQMSTLDLEDLEKIQELVGAASLNLPRTAAAISHLLSPHITL